MSLKSLIQWLLDSRTTAAEAAHSAMPKPETPTTVSDPVTDKAWHSLIAPFDGYFSCKGITKHMLIENSAAQWSGVTGLTSGGYMGFTLPMSKGSEVRYQLDHNSTGVMMTFSKTIGGGYNHFVRRALSCLRPSFNFLQRSFCKANPNGSATKQCLTIQQSGLSTRLKALRANTSLRVTGVSLFTLVAMNGRKSGMETGASLSPQRVLPTNAFKCLSLKAPKLGMSFRTPRPTELKKRPLSLFQQSERNALTGGALC